MMRQGYLRKGHGYHHKVVNIVVGVVGISVEVVGVLESQ